MPASELNSYSIPAKKAKELIIKYVRQGDTVPEAMVKVGKSEKSYEYYMESDKDFHDRIMAIRNKQKLQGTKPVPPFPEFCAEYLGQPLFYHQLQWFDLLEGRRPRDIHPAMKFIDGAPDLLLVNTPPEHAKSTTITVNYAVWRICQDPNIKIILVSKARDMAMKFLAEIKQVLTDQKFEKLQNDFGPPEGFDHESTSWRQDRIYVGGRTEKQKDPTVEALGIRGHIYGSRADLIILDDTVDQANAHEFEKQIEWIQAEVITRLSSEGLLLVVGTRMAPVDLYSELLKPHWYPDEVSPWTYFAQPAVLEFTPDPENWVTLWPRCTVPEVTSRLNKIEPDADGMYPKWNGPRLSTRRSRIQPRTWSMVYMQEQVIEKATFPQEAVNGCINGYRMAGLLRPEQGWRKEGMAGLYVVAGLDPAVAGYTAAVVMAVDRQTRKRWVLDVFNASITPDETRDLIKRWTIAYNVVEWRVEKNGLNMMLTQDSIIRSWLASRGVVLHEHLTNANKWDVDFGVSSMRDLFGTWRPAIGSQWEPEIPALIEFPTRSKSEPMRAMAEQLVNWYPEAPKTQKTDLVMALWFAEIRARELMDDGWGKGWMDNPYVPERLRREQMVVDLDQAFAESQRIELDPL